MQTIDYDTGAQIARNHECAVCGGRLTPAWGGRFGVNDWVLRCVADAAHDGYRRVPSLRERYLAGEPLPIHTENVLERKYGRRKTMSLASTNHSLARVAEAQKLGLFPSKMTGQQQQLLALVAHHYGLDPVLQEIIPYQGRPYITLEGRRRLDRQAGHKPSVHFRLLTVAETTYYEKQECLAPGDLATVCILKEGEQEVEAMGRVLAGERKGDSHLPTVRWTLEMAEKRGEYRARRRMYGPVQTIPGAPVVGEGAVIEGAATVVDPDMVPEPERDVPQAGSESPQADPKKPQGTAPHPSVRSDGICAKHNRTWGKTNKGRGHPLPAGEWCYEQEQPAPAPPPDLRTREELVQAAAAAGYKLADLAMVLNEDVDEFLARRPIAEAFEALAKMGHKGQAKGG